MEGRNLTIAEKALGFRKPVDRSDRFFIDLSKQIKLAHQDLYWEDIGDDIDNLRDKLGFETLDKRKDLKVKSILELHDTHFRVASKYLDSLDEKAYTRVEKYIYLKILVKYNLSFNFYPLVEYQLLYDEILPPGIELLPNPNMVPLYLKYKTEFIRNYHTDSDIEYFIMRLRTMCLMFGKARGEDKDLIDEIKRRLRINTQRERRMKNIDQFFDIQKSYLINKYFLQTKSKKYGLFTNTAQDLIDDETDKKNVERTADIVRKQVKRLLSQKSKEPRN